MEGEISMTKIFKTLLFISSYFPLYIILLLTIIPFNDLKWASLVDTKQEIIMYCILLLLIVISFIPLVFIYNCERNASIKAEKVTQKNSETLSYLVTYIVPILAIDLEKTQTLITNALLFVLIGFLYIKSNLLHINILFLIFGWNIYEDTSGRLIISRENPDYFKREELAENTINVRSIGSKIYLHKK